MYMYLIAKFCLTVKFAFFCWLSDTHQGMGGSCGQTNHTCSKQPRQPTS